MAEAIFLITDKGDLVEVRRQPYDSEETRTPFAGSLRPAATPTVSC